MAAIVVAAVALWLSAGAAATGDDALAAVTTDGSMPADELVAMLRSGSPVDLLGVTIVGDLDLRPIGTVTQPLRCRDCALEGSLTATDVVFERLVDLGGIRVAGDVDLGGAVFGDALLLERAEVAGERLTGRLAKFTGPASFDAASIAGIADFTGARFLGSASFGGTDFGASAAFDLATFAEDVVFTAADEGTGPGAGPCAGSAGAFRGDAGFARSRFGGSADFGSRCFGGEARFTSATFGGITDFALTTFEGAADFDESTFAQLVSFRVSAFEGDVSFEGVQSQSSMDFHGARFLGASNLTAVLFGLTSSGTLDLRSVTFTEGRRIDLTDVFAGRLRMDVAIAGQIIGEDERDKMLGRLEESARASGDIPLANDARFTLLSLQHEDRSGVARLFDAGYRTIGGYLVRPSYPLRALLWLLVFATAVRVLAWVWSTRPSRRPDGDDPPTKAAKASAMDRARSRVLTGQRLVTAILRKAAESIDIAYRKSPKIVLESEEEVWSYFYAAGRLAEFLAYKLLLVLFLLALANSNPTARQIVDSIRG
jgi:hypothetical protein